MCSQRRIARSHDVNEVDAEGNRALCMAAQNQCVPVLELLVASGADVNQRQRDVRDLLFVIDCQTCVARLTSAWYGVVLVSSGEVSAACCVHVGTP